MLHRSRWTLISFLLLLALVVPTNLVQAQSKPQALPDKNVAPSADLAVPDDVAQVVKLRGSLTADQISKIQTILDSHKAELQQMGSDLASLDAPPSAQDKKLFLPFVNANGNNANGNAQSQAKPADLAVSSEKAGKLNQITQRLMAVQDKIDQEIKALLTASQSEVYAKQAAKMKSTGQAMAAKLQAMPQSAEDSGYCFYGSYYGSISWHYGYYGYLWTYYNYYYYGTSYGYYAYLYAYYQWYYLNQGLPLSAAAYFAILYSGWSDYYGWSGSAYNYFYYAWYYSYYGYLYAYYDYQNTGHSYAYYGYYYEYYSDYYGYYGYYYQNLCS